MTLQPPTKVVGSTNHELHVEEEAGNSSKWTVGCAWAPSRHSCCSVTHALNLILTTPRGRYRLPVTDEEAGAQRGETASVSVTPPSPPLSAPAGMWLSWPGADPEAAFPCIGHVDAQRNKDTLIAGGLPWAQLCCSLPPLSRPCHT